MGEWRVDQSKGARRYVWQQTRGEFDETRRDFMTRIKKFPVFAPLRVEKIGSELHLWRQVKESGTNKTYWISSIRFVDDGWGYWTVFYRVDERRWRLSPFKELPIGRAISGIADFYEQTFESL